MPDLSYITTCDIKNPDGTTCGKQFRANPVERLTIGQTPGRDIQRFMGALLKHINDKHPQHAAVITNLGMQFTGYLITRSFQSDDPMLREIHNDFRFEAHQLTRAKHGFTDAAIRDLVARLGFTEKEGAPVVKAMTIMRDALLEMEKAPVPEPETPVTV